jgi:hypothetical protein
VGAVGVWGFVVRSTLDLYRNVFLFVCAVVSSIVGTHTHVRGNTRLCLYVAELFVVLDCECEMVT